MLKTIGAEELVARGVADLSQMRPILMGNEDPMAVNATLQKDEWERIDDRVTQVMRERITVVDDLRSMGLVAPVSLGTILRVTERLSDMDSADVSYDGDSAPTKDKPNFKRDVIPVPVIAKDFSVNWRQLDASRKRGDPLDVTGAGLATRKVRDQMESITILGFASGPGSNPANSTDGQSIPGLLTAAGRQTQAKSGSWGTAATDIIGDALAMLNKAYTVFLFGPFNMYAPKNCWSTLQSDYKTANPTSRTFLERILGMVDIKNVRPADFLTADNVVLLQMTEDVIDWTEAQGVTTVQWDKNPFVTHFRVLEVGGPQIKSIETSGGSTINGIVHLS